MAATNPCEPTEAGSTALNPAWTPMARHHPVKASMRLVKYGFHVIEV